MNQGKLEVIKQEMARVNVNILGIKELRWTEMGEFNLDWLRASLVAQTVKRLSTMWETQVRSLGWEVPWRRKWQSTPVLLPGKSHGQRSLVGYSPWGHKQSDMTEW